MWVEGTNAAVAVQELTEAATPGPDAVVAPPPPMSYPPPERNEVKCQRRHLLDTAARSVPIHHQYSPMSAHRQHNPALEEDKEEGEGRRGWTRCQHRSCYRTPP